VEIFWVKQAEFCLYSAHSPRAKVARMEYRMPSGGRHQVTGGKDRKKRICARKSVKQLKEWRSFAVNDRWHRFAFVMSLAAMKIS
jgi:hypothetical protein